MFVVGVKTTATFASAVTGVSPGLRKALRTQALKFLRPYGSGRSASLVMAIHKDPIAGDCIASLVRYHQEVWESLNNLGGAAAAGRLPLSTLHAAWRRVAQKPPRGWRHARGPISAAWLVVQEIGWKWAQAFSMTNTRGEVILLTKHSPATLPLLVLQDWQANIERSAAARLAAAQLAVSAAGVEVAGTVKTMATMQ